MSKRFRANNRWHLLHTQTHSTNVFSKEINFYLSFDHLKKAINQASLCCRNSNRNDNNFPCVPPPWISDACNHFPFSAISFASSDSNYSGHFDLRFIYIQIHYTYTDIESTNDGCIAFTLRCRSVSVCFIRSWFVWWTKEAMCRLS